jgi:hypothetical protein
MIVRGMLTDQVRGAAVPGRAEEGPRRRGEKHTFEIPSPPKNPLKTFPCSSLPLAA